MKPGLPASHGRTRLDGWSVLEAAPGSTLEPSALATSGWIDAGRARPVAAVLRDAGLWSLDSPARRFDASDWWYRTSFDAPHVSKNGRAPGTDADADDDADDVTLGFDGLATHVSVWLNGQLLGSGDNMFVSMEFAIAPHLKAQGNELVIRFASLDALLAVRRPRPKWRSPMVENQQLRWHRTSLLGRTPGWSPAAAAVGPWRDVWIRSGAALVSNLKLEARVDQASGIGTLAVSGLSSLIGSSRQQPVMIELIRAGEVAASVECEPERGGSVSGRPASARFSAILNVDNVERWWPHTHGEPSLYELRLIVPHPDASREATTVALGSVGFCTIEWDRSHGRFALKVNGVPVFCRGACWTPLDPVSLQAESGALDAAIDQIKRGGMNMLRIAGPFVYESDAFFDACDRHGVLVWSDFMFANMDYPDADASFARSVTTEVEQQLARWQARPCIAIVCGSSESEQQAAMWGAPREAWHAALFHRLLPELVAAHLPGIDYWPSSAHGGAFPHQVDEGTTSYYGVGAYLRPLTDARQSGLKFATECLAFANVPDNATIDRMPGGRALRVTHAGWKARTPRDLGAGWDFEDVRDHYLASQYGVEPARLRYEDHERYLQLSRAVTGEVMALAFRDWRRAASNCGGALVWFLRDLWSGAGWGLLDSAGRPKPCWYALQRALQPRTVFLTDEGNSGLAAHVANEGAEPLSARLELAVWRGADVVMRGEMAVDVSPHTTRTIAVAAMLDGFMDLTHAFRFGPAGHDACSVTLLSGEGETIAQDVYYPKPAIERQGDLGLAAVSRQLQGGDLSVTVSASKLARCVHFDAPGFIAQDAWFDLLPGQSRDVLLRRDSTALASPRAFVDSLSSIAPQLIKSAPDSPADISS